ncbi:hypothetical protein ACGFX2_38240 [Streptomyces goshikiensis]|uniref:hypothetical protein n=1 Tax=Streptomyces goshikiensis TaxID=1942 RepID=UPI003716C3CA
MDRRRQRRLIFRAGVLLCGRRGFERGLVLRALHLDVFEAEVKFGVVHGVLGDRGHACFRDGDLLDLALQVFDVRLRGQHLAHPELLLLFRRQPAL